MATTKVAYASSASLTITLNSLGNGSARESTAIDNSSNLYLDAHVRVSISAGSVSGAPLVSVYAYGSEDGSVYPDPVTGSDAAITLENPTVLVTNMHSLSDAEDFTEGYRAHRLGPIVGEPTARVAGIRAQHVPAVSVCSRAGYGLIHQVRGRERFHGQRSERHPA